MPGSLESGRHVPAMGSWMRWPLYIPPSGAALGGSLKPCCEFDKCRVLWGLGFLPPRVTHSSVALLSAPCLDTSSRMPSRLTPAVSSLPTWAHCVGCCRLTPCLTLGRWQLGRGFTYQLCFHGVAVWCYLLVLEK